MGLGLGAEVVCSFAMLSEFVPPQARGRAIGWLALLTNGPLLIASFMNVWIIPHFGWRYMFLIGGVGALIVWYLRKNMPESPRWLESKGRFEEAEATLRKIESEGGYCGLDDADQGGPNFSRSGERGQSGVRSWVLFSRAVVGRTLLGMYLHTVVNFCFYGFIGWLPTFLLKQGATITTSLVWTTVMAIGAPVGALIGLSLSDRIGRKPAIIGACLVAGDLWGCAAVLRDRTIQAHGRRLLSVHGNLCSACCRLRALRPGDVPDEVSPARYGRLQLFCPAGDGGCSIRHTAAIRLGWG